MSNYRISSGDKLLAGGVPLHTVDLTCDPFDIGWIGAEFRKLGNWQDMVQRVVQAKDNFFAGVGAAVVLMLQLLSNHGGVFTTFKTVCGSFLEIASFAKAVFATDHCRKRGAFSASCTETVRYPSISQLLSVLYASLTASDAIDHSCTSWRGTENTESLRLKSVVALFGILQFFGFILRFVKMSLAISLAGLSVFYPKFFRRLIVVYNGTIHQAHDLRSWVKLVWPIQEVATLGWASYILTQNSCKYRWNGGLP